MSCSFPSTLNDRIVRAGPEKGPSFRALQWDSDWCLAFLEASSSMCVKVVVELQIFESGRARDVHASTMSPLRDIGYAWRLYGSRTR